MTFLIILHLKPIPYSAATLSRNFHFYQLKVPKQLTQKYDINENDSLV